MELVRAQTLVCECVCVKPKLMAIMLGQIGGAAGQQEHLFLASALASAALKLNFSASFASAVISLSLMSIWRIGKFS